MAVAVAVAEAVAEAEAVAAAEAVAEVAALTFDCRVVGVLSLRPSSASPLLPHALEHFEVDRASPQELRW